MKNWVILVLVAVGCYWIYSSWFASDETPAQDAAQAPEEPPAREPSVPGEDAETDLDAPLRLDLGDGPAPEEQEQQAGTDVSWQLHLERQKAMDEGKASTIEKLTRRILKEYPESDAARWIHFERGREALRRFRKMRWKPEGLAKAHEARKELTQALFLSTAEAAEKESLREVLVELAQTVLFSKRHVGGVDVTFTPKRGAHLQGLCRKEFRALGAYLSPGFVAEVNGLKSPNHLRADEPLKVPLGQPRILVVKSEYRLYFLLDGAYVRDFPVGLGREDSTPEAVFAIALKQKNPDWYPKAGVRIPYGDSRNILGTRWLGFKNTPTYSSFGIHGTADPASIGRQASLGCIRMLRADVERLYGWTPLGTRVDVLP